MCTAIIPPQAFIHRLERRRSSTPRQYHHHHPLSEKLARLDPTAWLAPAVLRAHDAHEYRKDRRRRENIYRSHHPRRPEERARVHRDAHRDRVFYPEIGAYSHAKTLSSTTGTTTSTTTGTRAATPMEMWRPGSPLGWESVLEATSLQKSRRSEISLNDRARALEWACSTNVFSPGVLQEWMFVSDPEWWGDDAMGLEIEDRFGPDPWALRPLEEMP